MLLPQLLQQPSASAFAESLNVITAAVAAAAVPSAASSAASIRQLQPHQPLPQPPSIAAAPSAAAAAAGRGRGGGGGGAITDAHANVLPSVERIVTASPAAASIVVVDAAAQCRR